MVSEREAAAMVKPEQVILDTAVLQPPASITLDGSATLDIFDPSEGHLLALMRAQDAFHDAHGLVSDGHLGLTYFDQGDGGSILHFEKYDARHLRLLIALVPAWVWRGTSVTLEMNEREGD
jgi:hypothetical protein